MFIRLRRKIRSTSGNRPNTTLTSSFCRTSKGNSRWREPLSSQQRPRDPTTSKSSSSMDSVRWAPRLWEIIKSGDRQQKPRRNQEYETDTSLIPDNQRHSAVSADRRLRHHTEHAEQREHAGGLRL